MRYVSRKCKLKIRIVELSSIISKVLSKESPLCLQGQFSLFEPFVTERILVTAVLCY